VRADLSVVVHTGQVRDIAAREPLHLEDQERRSRRRCRVHVRGRRRQNAV